MMYQQQRMTSIRTQAHGVLGFILTLTRLETSTSLSKLSASTKLMLQKEVTKRYDISTKTNDFNSHPSTRCTQLKLNRTGLGISPSL